MATALQHITECSVCTNEFTEPRVLPCDHSFCQPCIDCIRKGSKIKCPVCSAIHDVRKVRPDFRLTQFIDAIRERELTAKGKPNKEAVCDLCCEEGVTHWCENCTQWLCKACAKGHLRIPLCKTHTLTPLSEKCKQVKTLYKKEDSTIRNILAGYSRSMSSIQEQVGKLEKTKAEALEQAVCLRSKALQDVNDAFDAVDARIVAFINEKVQLLEIKRSKLQKELKGIEAQWQQLKAMVDANSSILAMEGSSIAHRVKKFTSTAGETRVHMTDITVAVSAGSDWKPSAAVHLRMAGGKLVDFNAVDFKTLVWPTHTSV